MNIAIIYHDADFDGKLSNEVCRHWLKKLYPDAEIHSYGWDYGKPVPVILPEYPKGSGVGSWEYYDSIYIVDLSLIATKYGGGGHRGACGFRTTLPKLNEIIGGAM